MAGSLRACQCPFPHLLPGVLPKDRESAARAARAVQGQVPTPGVLTPLGTYPPRFPAPSVPTSLGTYPEGLGT